MAFRAVLVTDEVTQIVPYERRRVALAIANAGGATCYISYDRVNVRERGFPLGVGEKITFSRDRHDRPEEELNAQCEAGMNADVRVYETFEGE